MNGRLGEYDIIGSKLKLACAERLIICRSVPTCSDSARSQSAHNALLVAFAAVFQVHLQCVLSTGRYVVKPGQVSVGGESSAVLEFDAVALGGEIWLELEGM